MKKQVIFGDYKLCAINSDKNGWGMSADYIDERVISRLAEYNEKLEDCICMWEYIPTGEYHWLTWSEVANATQGELF